MRKCWWEQTSRSPGQKHGKKQGNSSLHQSNARGREASTAPGEAQGAAMAAVSSGRGGPHGRPRSASGVTAGTGVL